MLSSRAALQAYAYAPASRFASCRAVVECTLRSVMLAAVLAACCAAVSVPVARGSGRGWRTEDEHGAMDLKTFRQSTIEVLMCAQSCQDSCEDLEFRMIRFYDRFGTFLPDQRACIIARLSKFCITNTSDQCIEEEKFGVEIIHSFKKCVPALRNDATEADVQAVLETGDGGLTARIGRHIGKVQSAKLKASRLQAPALKRSSAKQSTSRSLRTKQNSKSSIPYSVRPSYMELLCIGGRHHCCALVGESQMVPCFHNWCVRYGFRFWCE